MGLFCSQTYYTNTGYDSLFHISTVAAQITDENYTVRYCAKNAKTVDRELLMQAVASPVILQKSTRLSETRISGGHAFWQEDISDLLYTNSQLEDTREELKSYGSLIQEENKRKSRQKRVEEQSRLYDAVQNKTRVQAKLISGLAEELQQAQDVKTAKRLLSQIVVVGAYVKRRSNLIFIADRAEKVPISELALCLDESAAGLRLLGVKCACCFDFDEDIMAEAAKAVLDFYEAVI